MASEPDGGELILQAFRDLGVDCIFCSPGSEWAPLWEAMARQEATGTAGPRYLDLMHETVAVGMAIGHYRMTGRMQAVLLHSAAGLMQGSMAVHGGWLADVPMIVLSSESNSYGEREGVDPGRQWHRNLSFVGGPQAIAAPFTKWACQVPGVETLYEFVKRAGEIAQAVPPGPVYLNCPVEVLLAPAPPPTHLPVPQPARAVAPAQDIAALVSEIEAARSPAIITESAGRHPDGAAALGRFAEAFCIPVYEGASATCLNLDPDHPFLLRGDPRAFPGGVDLVLLVRARAPWYPPSRGFDGARVIVIDEVPQRVQMVYQVLRAARHVIGDVAANLHRAADLAAVPGEEARRRAGLIAALRAEEIAARDRREAAARASQGPVDPLALVLALRDVLPAGTHVFDETITHASIVRQHLGPGSYTFVAGGLGQGMGIGLGAKLAVPGDMVVVAVGDGGFLYNPVLPALMASVREGLAILTVVFNNGQYLSMKNNHLRFYPDGHAVRRNRFPGVDLSGQPDIARVAEGCGCLGLTIRSSAELEPTVAAAVAAVRSGRSTVLDVHLSR